MIYGVRDFYTTRCDTLSLQVAKFSSQIEKQNDLKVSKVESYQRV